MTTRPNRLFLRPAVPGAVVRDPHTKRALPADGGGVEARSDGRRRLRDGDAAEATPPQPASKMATVTRKAKAEPEEGK